VEVEVEAEAEAVLQYLVSKYRLLDEMRVDAEAEVEAEAVLQYLVSKYRLLDEMRVEAEAEAEVCGPLWEPLSAKAQKRTLAFAIGLLVNVLTVKLLQLLCF
jgi:uncharacterized protein involved in exopolysaccharide biosynthesis